MTAQLSDFAKYVRPGVPGCPEPILLDAIQSAAIDFCTKTEILTEILELDLVIDQVTYPVTPTDARLYPAQLRAVLKNDLPIDPTTAARYASSSERKTPGSPTKYYAPAKNQVTFSPIPSAVETLELDVVLRPARDTTEVPDVLLEEWGEVIGAGAQARLLEMPAAAWFNADLSQYKKGLYDQGVATAAAEVAQGNTTAAMRVSPTEI